MAALAGCRSILGIESGTLGDGGLGQPCDTETDNATPCASGFTCVENVCQTECQADSDCPAQERCLSGDSSGSGLSAAGGCVPANDPCSPSCDLGANQATGIGSRTCGPENQCRIACNANAPPNTPATQGGCLTDQTCEGTESGCAPHPGSCPGVCIGSGPHEQGGSTSGDASADDAPGEEGSTQANSDAEATDAPPAGTSLINVPTCTCSNAAPSCAACPSAFALAVDGNNVFWTTSWPGNGGTSSANVLRCPVSGCGAGPTSLGAFQNTTPALYANGGDVYWANAVFTSVPPSTVEVCAGGTCASPSVLPSAYYYDAQLIGVNAGGMFFMASGGVYACPSSGCGPDGGGVRAVPGVGLQTATYALDTQHIYWFSATSPAEGEVDECPLSGCPTSSATDAGYAPNVLATSQQLVTAIAVDAQNDLFWSVEGSGSAVENNYDIVTCPLAGCAGNPTVLVANQIVPSAIVIDGSTVYWFNKDVGDIWSCATGGCNSSAKFVGHTGSGTAAIAFDASYLYWVSGQGLVARAPKPM